MAEKMEIEYKLLLTEAEYQRVLTAYPFQIQKQWNIYYDCGGRSDIAFRLRQVDEKQVFTCKAQTTGGLWETEVVVDGEVSADPQIQAILQRYQIQELVPLVAFSTIRHLYRNTEFELAVDRCQFGEVVDYELEYEVLTEHDHYSGFLTVIQSLGLQYRSNAPSKLARAIKYLL